MRLFALKPKSIRARVLIVFAAVLLLNQIVSVVVYFYDRASYERQAAGADLERRIELVRNALAAASPAEREVLIRALRTPNLNIQMAPLAPNNDITLRNQAVAARAELQRRIQEAQDEIRSKMNDARDQLNEATKRAVVARRRAALETDPEARKAALDDAKNADADIADAAAEIQRLTRQVDEKMVRLSMPMPTGHEMIQVTAKPATPPTFDLGESLLNFAVAASILFGLGWWATRHVTAPLALFSTAAERFGRNVDAEPMAEDGPEEVREAAAAFNRMQARLRRFLADRTTMLAAISHDLRTPLTRMRLRAEFVSDDEDRTKLISDLDEMETMIAEALAFARNEAEVESEMLVDLEILIREVAENQQAIGAPVTLSAKGPAHVLGRPGALKRCLTNLVRNAVTHGGSADIVLQSEQDGFAIMVRDNGPGIPEEDLDRVFTPFLRLEASRNRDLGGVGLGLSIARSTARAHGGDITLANRKEGGLEARLFLPAAPIEA